MVVFCEFREGRHRVFEYLVIKSTFHGTLRSQGEWKSLITYFVSFSSLGGTFSIKFQYVYTHAIISGYTVLPFSKDTPVLVRQLLQQI